MNVYIPAVTSFHFARARTGFNKGNKDSPARLYPVVKRTRNGKS